MPELYRPNIGDTVLAKQNKYLAKGIFVGDGGYYKNYGYMHVEYSSVEMNTKSGTILLQCDMIGINNTPITLHSTKIVLTEKINEI